MLNHGKRNQNFQRDSTELKTHQLEAEMARQCRKEYEAIRRHSC